MSTSGMDRSDGFSNMVSAIIKRNMDHMKFAAFVYHILSYSYGSIVYMVPCFVFFCLLL